MDFTGSSGLNSTSGTFVSQSPGRVPRAGFVIVVSKFVLELVGVVLGIRTATIEEVNARWQ